MAKQERALRTRRAVLEAAAEVIGTRGYQAATIAEIIEQAGVTKGALYFHFPSKQALADAILVEQTRQQVPERSRSPLQQAIDLSHGVADGLRTDPMLQAGTRIAVDTAFDEQPANPFAQWSSIISTLLEESRARGELLGHVDPKRTAALFVGAYTGVHLLSIAETRRADLSERVTELWQHLLPAIANPAVLSYIRSDGSPPPG